MSIVETGEMTVERAEKDCLRMVLLGRRKKIEPKDRCIWDSDIAKQLLQLPEYRAADTLLIYLSTPWEVSTAIPIAHAIGVGKQVAVPRWDKGSMEFCHFTDYRDMTPGRKGILQPTPDVEPVADLSKAICIVPALAADRQGFRIGYGGGYYDRFLSGFGGCSFILSYDSTVMEQLPHEAHDLAVDGIITPGRVIRIDKGDRV